MLPKWCKIAPQTLQKDIRKPAWGKGFEHDTKMYQKKPKGTPDDPKSPPKGPQRESKGYQSRPLRASGAPGAPNPHPRVTFWRVWGPFWLPFPPKNEPKELPGAPPMSTKFFAEKTWQSHLPATSAVLPPSRAPHLSGTVRNMAKPLRIRTVPWGHASACVLSGEYLTSHYTF